jgi:hypothetical protein
LVGTWLYKPEANVKESPGSVSLFSDGLGHTSNAIALMWLFLETLSLFVELIVDVLLLLFNRFLQFLGLCLKYLEIFEVALQQGLTWCIPQGKVMGGRGWFGQPQMRRRVAPGLGIDLVTSGRVGNKFKPQ